MSAYVSQYLIEKYINSLYFPFFLLFLSLFLYGFTYFVCLVLNFFSYLFIFVRKIEVEVPKLSFLLKKNFSTICIKYLGQVVVWIMHIDLYIYWCNHPLLNIGLNQLLICGQLGMWRNKIRMWTDSTRSLHFMIKLFQEY